LIDERVAIVVEMIKSFGTAGLELTMTAFNQKGKPPISSSDQKSTGKS